jgi:hypothetical protein
VTTRIEFYQQLREHIPDAAARLIAEETKVEGEVPSKSDLRLTEERLSANIAAVQERLAANIAAVQERLAADMALREERLLKTIEQTRSSMFRWQLVFFVPLWAGVYATLVAIVLRG